MKGKGVENSRMGQKQSTAAAFKASVGKGALGNGGGRGPHAPLVASCCIISSKSCRGAEVPTLSLWCLFYCHSTATFCHDRTEERDCCCCWWQEDEERTDMQEKGSRAVLFRALEGTSRELTWAVRSLLKVNAAGTRRHAPLAAVLRCQALQLPRRAAVAAATEGPRTGAPRG